MNPVTWIQQYAQQSIDGAISSIERRVKIFILSHFAVSALEDLARVDVEHADEYREVLAKLKAVN